MKRNSEVWLNFSIAYFVVWFFSMTYLFYTNGLYEIGAIIFGALFYFIPNYFIYATPLLGLLIILDILRRLEYKNEWPYYLSSVIYGCLYTISFKYLIVNDGGEVPILLFCVVYILATICCVYLSYQFIKEFFKISHLPKR